MSEPRFFKLEGNRVMKTSDRELDSEGLEAEKEIVGRVGAHIEVSGTRKFKEEIDKNPLESAVIGKFNNFIKDELIELGLSEENFHPLREDKIHFLPEEEFCRFVPEARETKIGGVSTSRDDHILMRVGIFSAPIQFQKALLHEMIHSASFKRYKLQDDFRDFKAEKGGYKSNKFLGLNEAVTDLVAMEILVRRKEELHSLMNFSEEEFQSLGKSLYAYCSVVEKIIDGIAEKNKEDRGLVWNRFKAGIFTGEMMHLRDIEKTYGPESLRKLASLGYKKETDMEVFNYFSLDEGKKEQLSKIFAS